MRCVIHGEVLYSLIQNKFFEYLLFAKLCDMPRMFGDGPLPGSDCELSLEQQHVLNGPCLYAVPILEE